MKVTINHLDNESATYSAPQTGGYRDKNAGTLWIQIKERSQGRGQRHLPNQV